MSRDVVDSRRREYRRIDTSTGRAWDPRRRRDEADSWDRGTATGDNRWFEGYDDDRQEEYGDYKEELPSQVSAKCFDRLIIFSEVLTFEIQVSLSTR